MFVLFHWLPSVSGTIHIFYFIFSMFATHAGTLGRTPTSQRVPITSGRGDRACRRTPLQQMRGRFFPGSLVRRLLVPSGSLMPAAKSTSSSRRGGPLRSAGCAARGGGKDTPVAAEGARRGTRRASPSSPLRSLLGRPRALPRRALSRDRKSVV